MKYRSLGRSGLRISVLSLGGNIMGHFCDDHQTMNMMRAAEDLGVNFIDTADAYSDGLSERYIGEAIRGHRAKWIIASKLGIGSHETYHGKAHPEFIRKKVEDSLRRLNTDYIDLYQLHHWDPETPAESIATTLEDLVHQGKIRYFGVSNYPSRPLREFLAASSNKFFISMQAAYNVLKREIEEEHLTVCKEARLGILAYGVLARGILTGKYISGGMPPDSRASVSRSIKSDLTEEVLQTTRRLDAFARKQEKNIGHLALAWVLRWPEVASLILGVRTVDQLKDNVMALDMVLSPEDLQEVDILVGDLRKYQDYSLGSVELSKPR